MFGKKFQGSLMLDPHPRFFEDGQRAAVDTLRLLFGQQL
jgi:hypothetical protein